MHVQKHMIKLNWQRLKQMSSDKTQKRQIYFKILNFLTCVFFYLQTLVEKFTSFAKFLQKLFN